MNSHVNRLFCFVLVLHIAIHQVSSKYFLIENNGEDGRGRRDYASNNIGRRKELIIEGGWECWDESLNVWAPCKCWDESRNIWVYGGPCPRPITEPSKCTCQCKYDKYECGFNLIRDKCRN